MDEYKPPCSGMLQIYLHILIRIKHFGQARWHGEPNSRERAASESLRLGTYAFTNLQRILLIMLMLTPAAPALMIQ